MLRTKTNRQGGWTLLLKNYSSERTSYTGASADWRDDADETLNIGLINLMPPTAMVKADKQFTSLLRGARQGKRVRVVRFASPAAGMELRKSAFPLNLYEEAEALWKAQLDGLIVTGTEPKAATMTNEPQWNFLRKVVDWAAVNTISTIWSCFSAHAAVFHLDGIERQPLAEKLSGVYECRRNIEHHFLPTYTARWHVPHSRFNYLCENVLLGKGHQILSKSVETGTDMFTKKYAWSQFLFFQGHPEYDSGTLSAEYARDIRRFLSGQNRHYPNCPENLYSEDVRVGFEALRRDIQEGRDKHIQERLNQLSRENLTRNRAESAKEIYSGWLSYINLQKLGDKSLAL